MSKRADPNMGSRPSGDAPKRARQMTVYDRLEDARRRRHELLSKGDGPAPRPIPSLKASNEPTAPPKRETRAETAPRAIPEPVVEVVPQPEVKSPRAPKPEPLSAKPVRRAAGGYWTGLLQAMAAIAVIAVLIAVSLTRDTPPQEAAIAAATPPPPVASDTPTADVAPTVAPDFVLIAARAAQSIGPTAPVSPESARLGLTIEPLVNPAVTTSVARVTLPAPDNLPLITGPDVAAPSLPQTVPPLILTSTPPARQSSTSISPIAPAVATSDLADATNVVLLVPAFVPQAQAENAIETAAALGIPVDQTRRANLSISQTNIRYFHAEDAEAATLLASGLGGIARDFTNFTPPPNPGVIEIWIEGQGGRTTNQGSATARGIEADLEALRSSIARALSIATGN